MYKNLSSLFKGNEPSGTNLMDVDFLQFTNVTGDDEKAGLSAPITREEIVYALSCIGSNKAPGPDGFTSHFFKSCWTIIEGDFVKVVQKNFILGRLLGEVNSTFLTLVPKVENPNTVADFRPISCYTVIYKCITKILAVRMKKVLKDLVSMNQSAFISGRTIQDNILLAHEIIRKYHRSTGSPRCSLKIIFGKPMTLLVGMPLFCALKEWDFLINLLHGCLLVFRLQSFLSLLMVRRMVISRPVGAFDKAALYHPTYLLLLWKSRVFLYDIK